MINHKKKILILIPVLLFIFISVFPFLTQAEERELEIQYPLIDEFQPQTLEGTPLPDYVRYIFNFAITISGLIVFGVLVYGGIRWMTSLENPNSLTDARNQILLGLIGLIVLLFSWLIFNTIDPELTIFDLSGLAKIRSISVPGVYLSPKETFPSEEEIESGEQRAYYLVNNVSNLKALTAKDEIIKSLKIVNRLGLAQLISQDNNCPTGTEEAALEKCVSLVDSWMIGNFKCCVPIEEVGEVSRFYGVVLHEKKDMQGNCEFYRSINLNSITEINVSPEPESVTVFQEAKNSQGEVLIYEAPDFKGKSASLSPHSSNDLNQWKDLPEGFEYNIKSIKVPDNFLLLLRGEGECAAINKSSVNLKEYNLNRCNCSVFKGWWFCDPCVTEYALFSLDLEEHSLPKTSECKAVSGSCEPGWTQEPLNKCEVYSGGTGLTCCCKISETNPEEKIILNSATGKTCNDLCQKQSMACSSVGTNALADNGLMWRLTAGTSGGCQSQSNISCGISMAETETTCSGNKAWWTNCYCLKQ
jgi:hypothetical protein